MSEPQAQKPAPVNNNNNNNNNNNTNSQQWLPLLLLAFSIYYLTKVVLPSPLTNLPYSEFLQKVESDSVSEVTLKGDHLSGRYHSNQDTNKSKQDFQVILPAIENERLLEVLLDHKVVINTVADEVPFWAQLLAGFVPWLLIIGFFIWSSRALQNRLGSGGGLTGFGRSKARRFESATGDVRYEDIAGLESAKQDFQEIIDYLKDPDRFHALDAHMPKGILMMGSPGTGKTMLAKATAVEAGVPFFSVSGSEFIEMFVGVGASRVRDMFAQARKEAPSLIFIDEIDSVGRVRGTGLGGGNDEREQTLNQILAEMDGFDAKEAVVVLAATNRPDVLDPALMRPGRFDRKVTLELPQRNARVALLKVHCRKKQLAESIDFEAVAAATPGFSGAELANLVNEAALSAVAAGRDKLIQDDFTNARDRVLMGAPRADLLNPSERKRIACHEAGHALIAHYSEHSDPVQKISIVPRGRALGVTEQIPLEDRHNLNEDFLRERLMIFMGGRVAEKVYCGGISTGAADDLKQATQLAYRMVGQWGMGKAVGPVGYRIGDEHPFLGREMAEPKEISDQTAKLVDDEVRQLLAEAESKATELLQKHAPELNALVEELLHHETLQHEEMVSILEKITK